MTCRVCGVLTSSVNIPNKPHDLCVKHWMLASGQTREVQVLDRIISDAKAITINVTTGVEQPEPPFLEADGKFGDPERDLAVGQ